jgi:hypothetical protein
MNPDHVNVQIVFIRYNCPTDITRNFFADMRQLYVILQKPKAVKHLPTNCTGFILSIGMFQKQMFYERLFRAAFLAAFLAGSFVEAMEVVGGLGLAVVGGFEVCVWLALNALKKIRFY